MNKKLRGLNIESLLFFDAEFVARNEELEIDSREFDLWQWDNRDRETDYFLSDKELCDLYKRKAALKPVFNKLVCISVAFINGDTLYYKNITGGEKEIIEEFYSILNKGTYTPVSFNGIGFDMPNIRLKYFQNDGEVELLERFLDVGKKPWEVTDNHLDLMPLTKGTLFYNLSLDGMCYIANIPSPKSDLKGDQVSAEYYKNGVEPRIAPYCAEDTIAVAKLFLKMVNKFDKVVNFVDKTGTEVEKVSVNALDHILASGELSSKTIEALVSFVESEKLDKQEVFVIVSAALSKNGNNQEDIDSLEEALYLKVDYSLIQTVVDKGNLGVEEKKELVEQYKDADVTTKSEVVALTEQYLQANGKLSQKRASEALKLLKAEL